MNLLAHATHTHLVPASASSWLHKPASDASPSRASTSAAADVCSPAPGGTWPRAAAAAMHGTPFLPGTCPWAADEGWGTRSPRQETEGGGGHAAAAWSSSCVVWDKREQGRVGKRRPTKQGWLREGTLPHQYYLYLSYCACCCCLGSGWEGCGLSGVGMGWALLRGEFRVPWFGL